MDIRIQETLDHGKDILLGLNSDYILVLCI
jgi:hypothetical protein